MRAYLLLFGIVLVSACSTTSKIWTPYDRVAITASKDVNPDGNQRPSPVQVKIYQLSSRTTFDNLDFDQLFYQGETLLSDQLLSQSSFMLQPKESITHEVALKETAAFVAVIAAYRDVDSARWKHIYDVKPYGHYTHKLVLGPNAIIEGEIVEAKPRSQNEKRSRRNRSRRQ
jgi:type VI secretion system protein VasD